MGVRVLLPHEILAAIEGSQCPFLFESLLLGSMSAQSRVHFWEHLKTLPLWKSHPALVSDSYCPSKLIGFVFHADGAQMYRDDEFYVWSLSCIFASTGIVEDVLAFQFPFCIIPERHMRSKNVTGTTLQYGVYLITVCL